MDDLKRNVSYYACHQLSRNPRFKDVKIIVSGL